LHNPIITILWSYKHFIFHYANGAIKQVRNIAKLKFKSHTHQNSEWWTRHYTVRTSGLWGRIQTATYNSVFTFRHRQSFSWFPQSTNFCLSTFDYTCFSIWVLVVYVYNSAAVNIAQFNGPSNITTKLWELKRMRYRCEPLYRNIIVIKYWTYLTTNGRLDVNERYPECLTRHFKKIIIWGETILRTLFATNYKQKPTMTNDNRHKEVV
jgi:hypothetical protein